jgi:hypothetical protein
VIKLLDMDNLLRRKIDAYMLAWKNNLDSINELCLTIEIFRL